MALIHCPECNREISDKVKACPYCGYPFTEDTEKQNQVQQVEVTGVKLRRGINRKPILIFSSVVVIAIIAFFGMRFLNEQKAQRLYQESYNTYIDNLTTLQLLTITGGAEAETLCNLTARVWNNAIWEERDTETDKFTRPNGYFVDDFNEALTNLYKASSTKSTINDIEDNQNAVQSLMKELQNPPEGLETCYSTATELYTAYQGFTNLAINPSGSYKSYSESMTSKDSDFMDAYGKLNSQIPDKIGSTTEK
jgi:hypothetical protein